MSLCGLAGSLTVHRTTSFGPLAARNRPLGENATALMPSRSPSSVSKPRSCGLAGSPISHRCTLVSMPLVARRRPLGENATALTWGCPVRAARCLGRLGGHRHHRPPHRRGHQAPLGLHRPLRRAGDVLARPDQGGNHRLAAGPMTRANPSRRPRKERTKGPRGTPATRHASRVACHTRNLKSRSTTRPAPQPTDDQTA
jgi:hypothetical protein